MMYIILCWSSRNFPVSPASFVCSWALKVLCVFRSPENWSSAAMSWDRLLLGRPTLAASSARSRLLVSLSFSVCCWMELAFCSSSSVPSRVTSAQIRGTASVAALHVSKTSRKFWLQNTVFFFFFFFVLFILACAPLGAWRCAKYI